MRLNDTKVIAAVAEAAGLPSASSFGAADDGVVLVNHPDLMKLVEGRPEGGRGSRDSGHRDEGADHLKPGAASGGGSTSALVDRV